MGRAVILPAALRKGAAADYCGVSPGHFAKLVETGWMPRPRDAGGVDVWRREELDEKLASLPVKGGEEGGNTCDAAFGLSA